MWSQSNSILPARLGKALAELSWWSFTGLTAIELESLISQIDELPPATISRADAQIATAAELGWYYANVPGIDRRREHLSLLTRSPAFAHLFIFHRDGYVREAALKGLKGGARSAFEVIAIAFRLNDWAEPVRRAAVACALRVFPNTDADKIAAASEVLFGRLQSWRRWPEVPPVLVDAMLRSDVTDRLAKTMREAKTGPQGALLRNILRSSAMDRHLSDLSEAAFLPNVRALALKALIEGEVAWQIGTERRWIDRSMGHFRQVPVTSSRPVARPHALETLVKTGAGDRSVIVRKVAADGLIMHRASLADVPTLVDLFASERHPAIKERIAFVMKETAQRGTD